MTDIDPWGDPWGEQMTFLMDYIALTMKDLLRAYDHLMEHTVPDFTQRAGSPFPSHVPDLSCPQKKT